MTPFAIAFLILAGMVAFVALLEPFRKKPNGETFCVCLFACVILIWFGKCTHEEDIKLRFKLKLEEKLKGD